MMGAGTGGLLIIRWFWWRINAFCEIVAMIVSFITAIVLTKAISPEAGAEIAKSLGGLDWNDTRIILGVVITTVSWLITAFVAPRNK